MRSKINIRLIKSEIENLNNGNFRLSEIVEQEYENQVRELLNKVVEQREKFENLSDLDKLTNVMVDKGIPRSAQVIDTSGNPMPQFNEKAATRRNTKKAAQKIIELADNDLEKAMEIVQTMS